MYGFSPQQLKLRAPKSSMKTDACAVDVGSIGWLSKVVTLFTFIRLACPDVIQTPFTIIPICRILPILRVPGGLPFSSYIFSVPFLFFVFFVFYTLKFVEIHAATARLLRQPAEGHPCSFSTQI